MSCLSAYLAFHREIVARMILLKDKSMTKSNAMTKHGENMYRICFFDLETEHLFQELDPGINQLSFQKKQARQLKLIPRLNMAVGCVISNDDDSMAFYYEKGQEIELIQTLNEFDQIIGYNIIKFDYNILSRHFKGTTLQELQEKTYDIFLVLQEASGNMWSGLDELCRLNLGTRKTLDTLEVPKLWRSGEKEKVKEYCFNDVLMLKKLFFYGKEKGVLKYPIKNYGKQTGVGELKVPWINLKI